MICFTLSVKDFYDFLRRARSASEKNKSFAVCFVCWWLYKSSSSCTQFNKREWRWTERKACLLFTCVHTINNAAVINHFRRLSGIPSNIARRSNFRKVWLSVFALGLDELITKKSIRGNNRVKKPRGATKGSGMLAIFCVSREKETQSEPVTLQLFSVF